MKPEKLIVTIQKDGVEKNRIWNSKTPLRLGGPSRWILEQGELGIQFRFLGSEANQSQDVSCIPVDQSALENGDFIELPNQYKVRVKHPKHLRPAYLSTHLSKDTEGHPLEDSPAFGDTPQPIRNLNRDVKKKRLFVFCGIGRALTHAQPIHAAYIASSRNKPVFSFFVKGDHYEIKPLFDGVRLKPKGQKAILGKTYEPWVLNSDQLSHVTLIRGSRWWRFNSIPVDQTLSESEWDDHERLPLSLDEQQNRSLLKIFSILSVLLLGLAIGIGLLPHSTPSSHEENNKSDAPVVRVILPSSSKKPKPPSIPAKVEARSSTLAATPAPAPATKPHKKARSSNPVAEKPTVAKISTQSSGIERKAAPIDKRAQQKKLAAERLNTLRSAFSGAMALNDSSSEKTMNTSATAMNRGAKLFEGKGTGALSLTKVGSEYSGSHGKVAAIGGSDVGSGAGYGHGGKALGGGGGTSLVSLGEGGGGRVDEGLTKDEVGAVIHSHLDEVRYCHEFALLYKTPIEGKLSVKFRITPGGAAETPSVESTTLPENLLAKCLFKKLVKWKFPKPRGGVWVTVSYPFIFKMLGRE